MTEYFRERGWAVTSTRVETPRADFDIASITAVEVSRMPLWVALGIGTAAIGSALSLRAILFPAEIGAVTGVALVLIAIAMQVGCLRVSGAGWRGTETGLVWGRVETLQKVRSAIRRAQEVARASSQEVMP